MATTTFHYLQTLVDDYLDHLARKKLFKLELSDWSKRLHCALRSYRELLLSLATLPSNLPEASKVAHRIKQDIFVEPEYREMLLRLLQAYDEERMSKAYLRDLIETNHVFLKMLDYHAKISFHFKIKVKKRKQTNKKNKTNKMYEKKIDYQEKKESINNDQMINPDELWIDMIGEVSNLLHSSDHLIISDSSSEIAQYDDLRKLFDPLNGDVSLDDQKLAVMRKICQLLRKREMQAAVRLFREARHALAGLDMENVFGEIGITPDDELLALNEIMMTDFPEVEKKSIAEKMIDEIESEEEYVRIGIFVSKYILSILYLYRMKKKNCKLLLQMLLKKHCSVLKTLFVDMLTQVFFELIACCYAIIDSILMLLIMLLYECYIGLLSISK